MDLEFGAQVRGSKAGAGTTDLLPSVKNIVLVASGKGGVGKSTVAANLAVALRMHGASVGLLDADIYGPSVPILMGVNEEPGKVEVDDGYKLAPPVAHGVPVMSIGFFLERDQAVIWRGPMLGKALQQLMSDVHWGELDYLVVDMPPGTGDVQITFSQQLKCSGAVLVATPQDVALADVVRAKSMFDKVHIPIVGMVENMSYFVCDGCGKQHEIFSRGRRPAGRRQLRSAVSRRDPHGVGDPRVGRQGRADPGPGTRLADGQGVPGGGRAAGRPALHRLGRGGGSARPEDRDDLNGRPWRFP